MFDVNASSYHGQLPTSVSEKRACPEHGQPPPPIPYTLCVGVTGHRNLADPQAVAAAVRRTLQQLRETLQNAITDLHQPRVAGRTRFRRFEECWVWRVKRVLAKAGILPAATPEDRRTELRWRVISAMAKGSDRIVAREAMDGAGASLEAVLPFAEDDYRHDFDTPGDRAEFDSLLPQAAQVVQLGMPYGIDVADDPEPFREHNRRLREAGYRRAGQQVVDACEILIAVWNGKPSGGIGGTAEVVDYALTRKRVVVWLNPDESGSPARIVAAIQKKESQSWVVNSAPLPGMAAGLSCNFVQTVEYNRDGAFRMEGFTRAYDNNWVRMEEARARAELPFDRLYDFEQAGLRHYARADHLALRYQSKHVRSATWLYLLAAIAVAVAVLQTLFCPTVTIWILLEIVALLAAVVLFRLGICESWNDKWLNYRHLAERLRAMMYTSLLGDGTEANVRHDGSLPFYPGPGTWVSEACAQIELAVSPARFSPQEIPAVKKFLLTAWIAYQARYHELNATKKTYLSRREQRVVGAMLIATLVAALLHLVKAVNSEAAGHVTVAAAIILPAFAAAWHAIGGIHDYERIAARSERMGEILRDLERSIEESTTEAELAREIRRAEDIMATENHEWCVSLAYRRPSLPV